MKKITIEKLNKTKKQNDRIIVYSENPEKWLLDNGFTKIKGPHWTQYEKENDFYREVAIIEEEKCL